MTKTKNVKSSIVIAAKLVGGEVGTYIHKARGDETPIEHLERVIVDFPSLEPFLSLASYETASMFVDGNEYDWSHCFLLQTRQINCLIQPGTIITVTRNYITIYL